MPPTLASLKAQGTVDEVDGESPFLADAAASG